MSDRSVVKTDVGTDKGNSSLDSLRTSKELGEARTSPDHAPGTETDLSQVSIASSGIPRVSAKTDKRIIRTPNLTPSNEIDREVGKERLQKDSLSHSGTTGILNNPHYSYQGNLLERFITFLANIMKMLEQLLLRFLGGGDAPLPQPSQQPLIHEPSSSSPDEERKKREEREKLQRELSIHRS